MPHATARQKDAATPTTSQQVTATEANMRLGYLLSRARFDNTRTVIVSRGKAIAAIVPMADLARLEQTAA